MKLNNEQWKQVDENINNAERIRRQADVLSRNNLGDLDISVISSWNNDILESIGLSVNLNDDIDNIINHAEQLQMESEEIMTDLENALVSLRRTNLSRALRIDEALDRKYHQVLEAEIKVRKKIIESYTAGRTASAEKQLLYKIEHYKQQIIHKREEVKNKNPESWYGLNLKELRDLRRDFSKGKIVETNYIKKQAEDIEKHILSGQPVFIHGHLGSGKTEIAFHVAKKILENRNDLIQKTGEIDPKTGKEIVHDNRGALVISGSKHTSLSELYGHMTLDMSSIDSEKSQQKREDFINNVEKRFLEWKEQNSSASPDEQNRQFELIKSGYQTELAGEYAKGTITDFYTGPVYKAMEEGRPVILDEVNAIPHEVLISLNHLLTRKPGDKVYVQQDSGKEIIVKDGFGFILTGNVNDGSNEMYIGREDMDPAFLSRLYKMEHQYLPQSTTGALDTAHIPNENGEGNELFEIMIARIMDRHGNISIPDGELRKIWNLAKSARVIQNIFAGKNTDSNFYFNQTGAQGQPYRLKEGVLSIRGIDKILSAWQSDGMMRELDYYVYKEFIGSVVNTQDRAFLYQLMHSQFGFFNSNGWDQSPDYGTNGKVPHFSIAVPDNKSKTPVFMSPRDTVDVMFGAENVPERTEFPSLDDEDMKKISPEAADIMSVEHMKIIQEVQEEFGEFEAKMKVNVEKLSQTILNVCPIEG